MLDLVQKAILLLPVIVAVNVALSAIGGIFEAISKAKGDVAPSGPASLIKKISDVIKKVIDIMSANLPHK
jgi:hypothetical protein